MDMAASDEPASYESSCYPLIAYVHVPKSAGTSVRRLLSICTPRGCDGVEFVINDRTSFRILTRKCDWIAGHVARDEMFYGLTWLGRPVEYFSSVREPVAQLVSHLNFSFERYNREDYYEVVNSNAQQIDAEVMSTDFSNPSAVMALLLRRADSFLNMQSRLVLGADFAELSDNEIDCRLASYTYVATEDDLPNLYRAFGFAELPDDADEIRLNVAKPHSRGEVFETPQMQKFLARHHCHDLRLYAAVRRASWSAKRRRPFRPAELGTEVFTAENFDEQTYLRCNSDVADAVKRGELQSGRAHFETWGYKEYRMSRRLVLPPAAATSGLPVLF